MAVSPGTELRHLLDMMFQHLHTRVLVPGTGIAQANAKKIVEHPVDSYGSRASRGRGAKVRTFISDIPDRLDGLDSKSPGGVEKNDELSR
jgi:hypothetical protein